MWYQKYRLLLNQWLLCRWFQWKPLVLCHTLWNGANHNGCHIVPAISQWLQWWVLTGPRADGLCSWRCGSREAASGGNWESDGVQLIGDSIGLRLFIDNWLYHAANGVFLIGEWSGNM